jgi:hypothetical protein
VGPGVDGPPLGAARLEGLDAGDELHLVALGRRLRLQGLGGELAPAAHRRDQDQDAQGRESGGEEAEAQVRHQEEHQVRHDHQPVQGSGEDRRGQGLADRGVARQAHQQVAGGALLEEDEGQADQMLQEVRRELGIETGAQDEEGTRAQEVDRQGEDRERRGAGEEDPKEVVVPVGDHPVHHDTGQHRHGERADLDQE